MFFIFVADWDSKVKNIRPAIDNFAGLHGLVIVGNIINCLFLTVFCPEGFGIFLWVSSCDNPSAIRFSLSLIHISKTLVVSGKLVTIQHLTAVGVNPRPHTPANTLLLSQRGLSKLAGADAITPGASVASRCCSSPRYSRLLVGRWVFFCVAA